MFDVPNELNHVPCYTAVHQRYTYQDTDGDCTVIIYIIMYVCVHANMYVYII